MLKKLMTQWSKIVVRHPFLVLFVAFSIAGFGVWSASHLGIKSNFAALLPENAQSVKDINIIAKRMGGMGTIMVMIEGEDLQAMQRFSDDLVKKLRTYPEEEIQFLDYKIDAQKNFYDHYQLMYLDLDELFDFREALQDRIGTEKLKASGLLIEFDDEEDDEEDDGFDWKKKKEEYDEDLHEFDKYVDGYLTNDDGTELLIVIKTPGTATGVKFAKRFSEKLEEEIENLDPTSYHPSIIVNLTGSLKTMVEEYFALREDILIVSNLCVGLVFLAVLLYYRSFKMSLILSTGLICGVLTTLGITYWGIGYLTASTAFLSSIVAGNGINFGIYYLARYMEERRHGLPLEETINRTLHGTVHGISTAAFAAGVSYFSLIMANFRGFNQFGFIGGVGMVVCLLFALSVNPALTVLMERYWPFKTESVEEGMRGRIFSSGAAWLVENHPRKVMYFGAFCVFVSIILLFFFMQDPFEYNYRKLRNQFSEGEGSGKYSTKAENILGKRSSPHIIMANRPDQVKMMKDELMKYHVDSKEMPYEKCLFKEIDTFYDQLPGEEKLQKKKLRILREIRNIILDNNWDFLDEEDSELMADLTPPPDLRVVSANDLPDEILRKYIELDGTRGTPVYVYMRDGMSVWNGRDLQKFAAVVREVKIPTGEVLRSSGHAVIFADMIKYVSDEGPWISALAFFLVVMVIFISFRNLPDSLVLTVFMASGVIFMMGVVILMGEKINFLNFIAIPIEFGIGVDYHVNLHSRFRQEGAGSIAHTLRTTGGAVMITSLTTIIGYGALWFSLNGAINSFGTLANVGEFTCLSMAVLFMPAYLGLYWGGFKKKEAKGE